MVPRSYELKLYSKGRKEEMQEIPHAFSDLCRKWPLSCGVCHAAQCNLSSLPRNSALENSKLEKTKQKQKGYHGLSFKAVALHQALIHSN